jgi:peptidoglycan/LPS O-acetylase OafA/YrhL
MGDDVGGLVMKDVDARDRSDGDGMDGVGGVNISAPRHRPEQPKQSAGLSRGQRLAPLDGIRGLAVIAVLLYHASVLRGGYLGVDVFFVLSGFLITVLLAEEHERTGGISLRSFWLRRGIRLLPALAGYLLFGLVAAVALKPVHDQQQYAIDAATSFFGVNNWWRIVGGEEAAGAWDGHLWSLSVEAQFYLMWPAVVAALLAVGRRVRRIALTGLIGVVVLWRLAVMLGLSGLPIDAHSYFGTDTRADALLIGALLAVLWREGVLHRWSTRIWGAASAAAWLLLITAMLLSPTLEEHPRWLGYGGFTLLALVAAVAVAGPVLAPGRGMSRLLAWPPVVWLGGISYALYLWHFPITIELEGRFGDQFGHLPVALVALLIAAGFAWLSGKFLERPVSRRRRSLQRWLIRPVGPVAAARRVWSPKTWGLSRKT